MRGVTILLLVAALAGCRFERRPDAGSEGSDGLDQLVFRSGASTPMEDSVRALALAIGEALQLGDVARIARLTVATATLIDVEEAVRWTREEAAGPLPSALTPRRPESLTWTIETSQFVPLGSGALLVNEYRGFIAGENVPWKAVETLVLIRTEQGWRLRHLHRSRGALTSEPIR